MYAWIWNHIPGPKWLKVIEALIIFFLVVMALFLWVFPWLTEVIGYGENVVSTE